MEGDFEVVDELGLLVPVSVAADHVQDGVQDLHVELLHLGGEKNG